MQKEKNVGDLRSNFGPQVRREVNASVVGVSGQNKAAPLLNSLGRVLEHVKERKDAKNEEAVQRGIRDQSLGKVDANNDDAYYMEGVRRQETYARGLEWFNNSIQDLPQRFADDEDFDYETWKQERVAEYLDRAKTPEEIKSANGQVQRFLEAVDSSAARIRADIAVKKGTDALASTALEAVRGGAIRSADDFKTLIAQGEQNVGMGRDEAIAVAAPVALDAIANGDIALADAVRGELENDPRFGLKLQQAIEQGTYANERKAEEERREKLRTNLRLYDDIERRIESGSLSYDYIEALIDEKVINAEEGAGMMSRQRDRARAAAEKAREDADSAAEDLRLQGIILNGQLAVTSGDDNTAGKRLLDSSYSTAALALADARRIQDPAQRQEAEAVAQAQLANALAASRKNGYMPKGLKQTLSSLDFGNPDAALETLSMYRTLRENGHADFLRGQLDAKTMARLDGFEAQLGATGNSQQAVERLSQLAKQDPNIRRNQLNSVGRQITAKAAELAGGDLDVTATTARLTAMVDGYVSVGMAPEAALERAAADIEENYVEVNGQRLPRGVVSDDFEDISGDFRERVLRPYLKESASIADDADIKLTAIPNRPGQFYVLAQGEYGQPEMMLGENGRPLIVDESRMAAQLADIEQVTAAEEAKAAQEAAANNISTYQNAIGR